MAQLRVTAERNISAPPGLTYACFANYRDHHHRFLPSAFSDFVVEQGGYGNGTICTFNVRLMGMRQRYRIQVTEPRPGELLAERDLLSGAYTTFTVAPAGSASQVRIETSWSATAGPRGLVERLLAPRLLRRLYREELELLNSYVGTIATDSETRSIE